jgi:excisionase family DNA binding protein
MDDRLYTLKETAAYLRVSEKTARKMIKDGNIKASMIGGRWKVTPEEIQRFINSTASAEA